MKWGMRIGWLIIAYILLTMLYILGSFLVSVACQSPDLTTDTEKTSCEIQLRHAEKYLEAYSIWAQIGDGVDDWQDTQRFGNSLVGIDNDRILDAWEDYQTCPDEVVDYYWWIFAQTMSEETEDFLEGLEN